MNLTPTELIEMLRRRWDRRRLSGAPDPPRVELDWREYFRRFCDLHGKFPLVWAGKLLFPDGWTYSATDHAGPEWPPPDSEEETLRLRRAYWKLRRHAVRRELILAKDRLRAVEHLLATRSAVPAQKTTSRDPETGAVTTAVGDVDASALRERIRWLEEDLAVCDVKRVDPDVDAEELLRKGEGAIS